MSAECPTCGGEPVTMRREQRPLRAESGGIFAGPGPSLAFRAILTFQPPFGIGPTMAKCANDHEWEAEPSPDPTYGLDLRRPLRFP